MRFEELMDNATEWVKNNPLENIQFNENLILNIRELLIKTYVAGALNSNIPIWHDLEANPTEMPPLDTLIWIADAEGVTRGEVVESYSCPGSYLVHTFGRGGLYGIEHLDNLYAWASYSTPKFTRSEPKKEKKTRVKRLIKKNIKKPIKKAQS